MTRAYKILGRDEWERARSAGVFHGSAVDERDGYIHLSTARQAAETARLHFAGRRDLLLLELDAEALGPALKWEPSRGERLFPHLYGPLPVAAVRDVRDLPLDAEGLPQVGELEP